jgi:hypothetical protein
MTFINQKQKQVAHTHLEALLMLHFQMAYKFGDNISEKNIC